MVQRTRCSPSEFIKEKKENFFSELKKHGDDWKDLEIALGEFTINFQTAEEFRNFYTDINESLYNYLKSIDGKIKVSLDDAVLFYRSLVLFPDIYLNKQEAKNFSSYALKKYNVNIISFNYTSSIKNIIDRTHSNICLYIPNFQQLKHIHGHLSEDYILFGVDSVAQISNNNISDDIKELLVKPLGNENIGNLLDEKCSSLIERANIICLFGTSLGKTDSTWWSKIKEIFKSNNELIIVYFCFSDEKFLKQDCGRIKRRMREDLISKLDLGVKEDEVRNRIIIVPNSEMFPKDLYLN